MCPRLVLSNVSGPTSKSNSSPRITTTVKHAPLTATLSPTVSDSEMRSEMVRRRPTPVLSTRVTVPSDSIRPVNIENRKLEIEELESNLQSPIANQVPCSHPLR